MKTILTVTMVIIIATVTQASDRLDFDYYSDYPDWVRSSCREITRSADGSTNYRLALICAENTMDAIREEEMRQAILENLEADTRLKKEQADRIEDGDYLHNRREK